MSASVRLDRDVLVDTTSVPSVRWHDGAGTTREIWTEGGAAAWEWRLSLADLSQAGPFSVLPGIDRWHLPLDGGYTLSVDGRSHEALAGTPIGFAGEAATVLTDIGAPTRALNLMTRRGACSGHVVVGAVTGPQTWASTVRAVVLLSGEGTTATGANIPPLGTVVAGAGPLRLVLTDAVVAEIHIDH